MSIVRKFYWALPSWIYHVEHVHIGRKVIQVEVVFGLPVSKRVIRELPVSMT